MTLGRRRIFFSFAALTVMALVAAGLLGLRWRLGREIAAALDAPSRASRPLSFAPLVDIGAKLPRWGSGEVAAVALTPVALVVAGSSGTSIGELGPEDDGGLPTLRASALCSWRGTVVVGLEAGGFFRGTGRVFEEGRTGWGTLHVRALVETEGGELLIGAREGLFRAAWGEPSLSRLDVHPVRSLAVAGRGFVIAGGEDGLYRVEASRVVPLETTEPWIDSVGLAEGNLFAATPAGLLRGPVEGPLRPVPGAEDVASGVAVEGAFWGVAWPRTESVRRVTADRVAEEHLPALVLRTMTSAGALFADTDSGLYRRGVDGWALVRPRPEALPAGSAHLSALAILGERLVAGTFDGGLSVAEGRDRPHGWRAVPASAAWGVNALLPAGGELFIASLRGAARFDGSRLRTIEGPGAAFALAATDAGVAIGYAQGVRLPSGRLLSAFHGLPGNQVLSLAASHELFVGTPSGLGGLAEERVRWRTAAGEGKLPHPWVTALSQDHDRLYVGTYGGGVAVRTSGETDAPGTGRSDRARYASFPETEGLKINAGCLVRAGGRLFAGTDGAGLWRLARDGSRFERLALRLPSPRVTALVASDNALYVGTDEGLARVPLGEQP
jgi:hypothetical protein